MNATITKSDAGLRMPAYPLSILIGCAALDEVEAFDALPDGFWRVVTRLVKKICVATPFQVIFAKRDTLARESGKSVETVGRALRWLENEGFITRKQKARFGLRGSEAHIQPTEKLIRALGIGQKRQSARPAIPDALDTSSTVETPNSDIGAGSAVKTDGSLSALQVHSLLKKKQSEETRANTSLRTDRLAQRLSVVIEGKIIPSELAWMTKDRGLPATGILRLMKLSKQAGKRLSDIVACCRDALSTLRGKALFAYVRALIRQNKDFAGILRQTNAQGDLEHQQQQDKALVARKASEWNGQRFISLDKKRIWVVETSGFITVTTEGKSASRRIDKGFVEAVMDGKLRRLTT